MKDIELTIKSMYSNWKVGYVWYGNVTALCRWRNNPKKCHAQTLSYLNLLVDWCRAEANHPPFLALWIWVEIRCFEIGFKLGKHPSNLWEIATLKETQISDWCLVSLLQMTHRQGLRVSGVLQGGTRQGTKFHTLCWDIYYNIKFGKNSIKLS